MVFGQDKFIERGQQGQSGGDEKGIFSNNFGGLNKVASPLNIPYEDAVDLVNFDIDVSGNLVKRKGTKLVYWDKTTASNSSGVAQIPFSTGLGYNFKIRKNITSLSVDEVVNDVPTNVWLASNIWDASAANIRPNYTSTNELEPRLILTTGVNPPVELRFIEQQQSFTGTATTSIVFNDAERYANISSNLVVYRGRVRQTGFSTSYNAGTKQLTIFNLPAFTGTFDFDIILIVWNWWAEAVFYYGDRFFQATTRFNAVQTDQNVEIPSKLRDDLNAQLPTFPTFYPIRVYKSTAWNDIYQPYTSLEPPDWNSYAFGDGARYVYTAGKKVNPSPLFTTFGAIPGAICAAGGDNPGAGAVTCNPQPVYMVRTRNHYFRGNAGQQGQYIKVLVDGTSVPQEVTGAVANPTYGAWSHYGSDTATFLSSATFHGHAIAFNAAATVGVPSIAKIEIINTQPVFLGASATSSLNIYTNGACKPIYGLGFYANYGTGSFPTNVALYQGRLVFSGFPDKSLQMCFSSTYDSTLAGKYFSSFQADEFAILDSDPFDMTLSSSPDDYVTGMMEWQNSLFMFTRRSVFRVSGSQNVLTNKNKFSVYVSNVGLVNSYCLCRTDKSLLYLSDSGVYDLATTTETSEYLAAEKSLKIRTLFGITRNPLYEDVPWMAFDSEKKVVYLGYPDKNTQALCYRLYVYNTFREAWSEYTTPGGWNTWVGSPYVDRQLGQRFLLCMPLYRTNGDPNLLADFVEIRMDYDKYIDFAQTFSGSGVATNYEIPNRQFSTFFSVAGAREYAISRTKTGAATGIDTLPMLNVKDISIVRKEPSGSSTYRELTFGTEWVKLPNGNILLFEDNASGIEHAATLRRPVVDSPQGLSTANTDSLFNPQHIVVFLDNKPQLDNTFTYNNGGSFSGVCYRVNINIPVNVTAEMGQVYPAYYVSPEIAYKDLSKLKRMKHFYVYVQNNLETWLTSDLAVTQIAEALVGLQKHRSNISLSVKYNSSYQTQDFYDVYGYTNIHWGDAGIGIDSPHQSSNSTGLFKIPLQGSGYSYQLILWSFDESTIVISGWQVTANTKGSRGYSHG